VKKRINPILAWFVLGLLSTALTALIAWLITVFSIIPFSEIIVILFAILGFLPGLFAMLGFRVLGFAGLAGILVGILWGFIHAIIFGSLWQYVFVLDFLRVYSIAMIVGCIGQLIVIYSSPRKSKRKERKNNDSEPFSDDTNDSRDYEAW